MDPEDVKKLETELKEHNDAMIVKLNERDEEIKKLGQAEEKTGQEVKALGETIVQLQTDLGKAQETTDDYKKRLEELELKSQRGSFGGDEDEAKTIGRRFVESAEYLDANKNRQHKTLPFVYEKKSVLTTGVATRLVVPERAEPIMAQERTLQIRDLFPVRQTQSNSVEYIKETGFAATGSAAGTQTQGAAEFFPEGSSMPETQVEMTNETATVHDIGHALPVSRNMMRDAGQIEAMVEDRLLYGVGYAIENKLLYADGTGAQIEGVLANASIQSRPWSTGSVTTDTKLDAVRRAMTLAFISFYQPTAGIVHPTDWEEMELIKGTDEHYVWIQVAIGGEPRIFRLPVVVTTAINDGTALVGDFQRGATVWDREQSAIEISDSHKDYFTSRILALLAYERLAFTVYRPDAFVKITFDAAPTA